MTTHAITIVGAPRSKKNSSQMVIVRGRRLILPSKAYRSFEGVALPQVRAAWRGEPLSVPVNLACRYWLDANRRTDLVGLLQATLDILVRGGVLSDDSAWNPPIAVSYDGSAIMGKDAANPRTEITITEL
jgi:Holliday junction resolvase RusA-like endonuclease